MKLLPPKIVRAIIEYAIEKDSSRYYLSLNYCLVNKERYQFAYPASLRTIKIRSYDDLDSLNQALGSRPSEASSGLVRHSEISYAENEDDEIIEMPLGALNQTLTPLSCFTYSIYRLRLGPKTIIWHAYGFGKCLVEAINHFTNQRYGRLRSLIPFTQVPKFEFLVIGIYSDDAEDLAEVDFPPLLTYFEFVQTGLQRPSIKNHDLILSNKSWSLDNLIFRKTTFSIACFEGSAVQSVKSLTLDLFRLDADIQENFMETLATLPNLVDLTLLETKWSLPTVLNFLQILKAIASPLQRLSISELLSVSALRNPSKLQTVRFGKFSKT